MATLNLTADNDVIVPSNDDTTYRGLGGNDTYILVSVSYTHLRAHET